jgi:hypothetical protein
LPANPFNGFAFRGAQVVGNGSQNTKQPKPYDELETEVLNKVIVPCTHVG